jgi:hypothetical protein
MPEEYACTHVSKTACIDRYDKGCETQSHCVLDEPCNISAPTFAELLTKIGQRYGITIDDAFIPDDQEERTAAVDYIGWNRTENADGDEPTERQLAKWKKGEEILYLADWTFHVEVRTIRALAVSEIKASGVKTH